MIIFTSVCANYVHKARTLAKSVKANIPDATMILCLVEREIIPNIKADCFDEIILAKDMWDGNFDQFIFKHEIVEASTAVKGQMFRYLMKHYNKEEKFVYLDPDVYVYSDFEELKHELDEHSIILCPHLLHPGNIDMELSSTAHGVYNLGFLGIKRSEEGLRCINWWADRLFLYCYDDIQKGIFTDQKWFDLAPCFFNVKIFKHYGYDFAPWALYGTEITKKDGVYYINGDPLRFIHFSGLGATAKMCMDKWMGENCTIFCELYNEYVIEHDKNDVDKISKTIWSYSKFHSGEKIDNNVRKAYRSNYDVMFACSDPFNMSNSYYRELLQINENGEYKKIVPLKRLVKRALEVIRNEGIIVFSKKVINKLSK